MSLVAHINDPKHRKYVSPEKKAEAAQKKAEAAEKKNANAS